MSTAANRCVELGCGLGDGCELNRIDAVVQTFALPKQAEDTAMNTQATHSARSQHARGYARPAVPDSYDWEELPSLAHGLRRSDFSHSATPVWHATEPQNLTPVEEAPSPFRETLSGLHVREIAGDEVFQHFFGDN